MKASIEQIRATAAQNMARAAEVVRRSRIEQIWREAGCEPRAVGSVRMGLLATHRDIDYHIYSDTISVERDFAAIGRLAANPRVERVDYRNLLATAEECIEWHAWYRDSENELWQLDMIHIVRGSRYDGYFEHIADRVAAVLTAETRDTILRLKFETPAEQHIMGIEYYHAVIADGVRSFDEFVAWRATHPVNGIDEWIP